MIVAFLYYNYMSVYTIGICIHMHSYAPFLPNKIKFESLLVNLLKEQGLLLESSFPLS